MSRILYPWHWHLDAPPRVPKIVVRSSQDASFAGTTEIATSVTVRVCLPSSQHHPLDWAGSPRPAMFSTSRTERTTAQAPWLDFYKNNGWTATGAANASTTGRCIKSTRRP